MNFCVFALLKTKASVNFHAKMYAIDRAKGFLCRLELNEIFEEMKAPDWFKVSVENQYVKFL